MFQELSYGLNLNSQTSRARRAHISTMEVYIPVKVDGVATPRCEKIVTNKAQMLKNQAVRTAFLAHKAAMAEYNLTVVAHSNAVEAYNATPISATQRANAMRVIATALVAKADAIDKAAAKVLAWRKEILKVLDRCARVIQPWARARVDRLKFLAYKERLRSVAREFHEPSSSSAKRTEAPLGPRRTKRRRKLLWPSMNEKERCRAQG